MPYAILLMVFYCAIQVVDSRPLPELSSFLQNIRKHLHSDRIIQSRYTFNETAILRELDSDLKVKKTETSVYEVYPSVEEALTYRKLISKNGKPVSPEEIKKHDNESEKNRRQWERRLAQESASEKLRREAKEKKEIQKEEEILDEAFLLYKITLLGRDEIDGISVIALGFEPKPDYRPKTPEGKILSNVRGKAWFSEADQELVRIDAETTGNLSFGLGVIAKLNKGTTMVFQRRKINDEVWLPAMSRFVGTGRILLLKGFRIEQETLYSDYRKFTVETVIRMQQ
jgi:hypothetical protein